jgi:hypothetical protein
MLETLSETRDMILGLPEGRQRESYRQHATELLRYAAENDKEAIDDMRAQLNRALYRDGFMWVAGFFSSLTCVRINLLRRDLVRSIEVCPVSPPSP